VKTCTIIHTLISFIEHANEDREFIGELMHEGADTSPNFIRLDSDGPSDILQDTLGQCKGTQLKDLLFESLDEYDMMMYLLWNEVVYLFWNDAQLRLILDHSSYTHI
jgi:hypothetical protein